MISFLRWVGRRLKCTVYGHRFKAQRIYYPPAKSVQPGFCCERCAKTQTVLRRWDEVVDDE